MRDENLSLQDILDSIQKIKSYIAGLSYHDFIADDKTLDAVLRNLEIIGEASKNLSETTQKQIQEVEWRKIRNFRNIVIHEYFGVSTRIIWDILQNKLDPLQSGIIFFLQSNQPQQE